MDTLISYGDGMKVLGETAEGWHIGGRAIVFDSHDVSHLRDKFTKATDYDIVDGDTRSLYFHHGLDDTIKAEKLGSVKLSIKEDGVWYEGSLKRRTDYLKAHAERIADGIKRGVFGTSTGAPAHLVRREACEGGHEIKLWPLAEVSITPTPAEPLTTCMSLKSLVEAAEETKRQIKGGKGKLPAGHWITHNGAHIFLPDYQVNQDHVFAAGVAHDLGEEGHKELDKAYQDDQIHTSAHLHLALAHAARMRAQGMGEAESIQAGLKLHGYGGNATHAERYRDAVEAQKQAQLAVANKEAIEARRERIAGFRAVGQDVVDYVSNHAQTYEEAQQMAKDLGFRHGTWDDQASVRRREKARKSVGGEEFKAASLIPTEAMQAAARNGLERHANGESGDGLEPATVERARKIASGAELTPEHVKRMHSFFSRHAGNRQEPGTPWYTAWQLWGGDAGQTWAANKGGSLSEETKSLEILEAGQISGSRFVDHTDRLHDAIGEYARRFNGFAAVKAGRAISKRNHGVLSDLHEQIAELHSTLGEFLDAHAITDTDDETEDGTELDGGESKALSGDLGDIIYQSHLRLLEQRQRLFEQRVAQLVG